MSEDLDDLRSWVIAGAIDLHQSVTMDQLRARLDEFEAAVRADAVAAAPQGGGK